MSFEDNVRAYALLLLASMSRLKYLDVHTTRLTQIVVYDTLNLLSHGHLPNLKRLYFHNLDKSSHLVDENVPSPSLDPAPDTETTCTSTITNSSLERIELCLVKVDMKFVKRVLELPSSLSRLRFSFSKETYDELSLAELGDAIKLQSPSLRNIKLQFPSSIFPPTITSSVNSNGRFTAVTAESLCIGSFQDFKALSFLKLPFDALFGSNPRNFTSFSKLLPINLRGLVLQRCMFRTPDGSQRWEMDQVLAALDDGLCDLAATCPLLSHLVIACLTYRAFKTLDEAWHERRNSQDLKEKLRSSEAWKQSTNLEVGSNFRLFSLAYQSLT
jgi:hypothetical protein